ncbi:MAG: hypothetical protein ACOVMS_08385, partial [Flavobacterium sp.]
MKNFKIILFFILFFGKLSINNIYAQNIYNLEPIQVVGQMNGYNTAPIFNTEYRKLSTNSFNPVDGRGQWKRTFSVFQNGGNFINLNMNGGAGNGFLFISGPSNNRWQNKWVFSSIAQGTINQVNNITAYNYGNDMGLNLSQQGYYTFVFNDCGYTSLNSKYFVSFTTEYPISVSNNGQIVTGNYCVVDIKSNKSPSIEEKIYVRYRIGVNDFTSQTQIIQASGNDINWIANIPFQDCSQPIYYYVFTSTRTLSQLINDTEINKSLSVINFDDNSGSNYQFSPQPNYFYSDADDDGYGFGLPIALCEVIAPAGYSTNNIDCNDADETVWQSGLLYVDTDGDGYDNGSISVCYGANTPLGYATTTNGTDCNDSNSNIHIAVMYYVDADGDGYGSTVTAMLCESTPPSGYASNNTDCDDTNVDIHTAITYYVDADGDGFGSTTTALLCETTA